MKEMVVGMGQLGGQKSERTILKVDEKPCEGGTGEWNGGDKETDHSQKDQDGNVLVTVVLGSFHLRQCR